MPADIALYIHVPFCRRKCRYCSFVSCAGREADIPAYLTAVKGEIAGSIGGDSVSTVFLGGGTPSLLPADDIDGILELVRPSLRDGAEVSIEANPATVDAAWLRAVRETGVNRLSLGVQSFNDDELAMLGRLHTADEARETVRQARDAGFDNLNIDLIYGLPGQTLSDWRRTLAEAIACAPEHLSLYALTLEEETPIWRDIERGALPEPDPDTAADHYELAEDVLAAAGYGHYEISNWALAGRECRHNLTYWENRPYIGVGVAAHSCREGRRYANTASLDEYLAGAAGEPLPPELDEEIGPELAMAETVILGLRLCQGIAVAGIEGRFGIDPLARYQGQIEEMTGLGLLEQSAGRLRLTGRGRLLSNEVFWRFLPEATPAGAR